MLKHHVVITTVGTSSATNVAFRNEIKLPREAHNGGCDAPPHPEAERVLGMAASELERADSTELMRLSAELNVLLDPGAPHAKLPKGMVQHYLIATDTWLGRSVAELLQAQMNRLGMSVEVVRRFAGLSATDATNFRSAVGAFAGWFAETSRNFAESKITFNLNGGLKGFNSFVCSIAHLHGASVVFKHEHGNGIIEIPALPERLDGTRWVRRHLEALRRLNQNLAVSTYTEGEELFIDRTDDLQDMTLLGKFLFESCRREIYESEVLPPPSARLVFGERFLASVKGLDGSFRARINEKLDKLAYVVEADVRLSGVDLKPLVGDALKKSAPSTHEVDAWHDGAAMRLFLHEEKHGAQKPVWVIDRLGSPFH